MTRRLGGLVGSILAAAAVPAFAGPLSFSVTAAVETAPLTGDADDPAIWVNPSDPAASLVLGTDKQQGLRVYALDGSLRQAFDDGELNNVDIRPLDGIPGVAALAGATKREDDTLVFYLIADDGTVRRAEPFQYPGHPAAFADAVDDIYGFALQRDRTTGQLYAIDNYKTGHVFQWAIEVGDDGRLSTALARSWQVGTQPEGMVADDASGHIYVGEEDRGIWRFPASPDASAEPTLIDEIGSGCLLRDDVEGLAIMESEDGAFLVASAQGIHRMAIYVLDGPDAPACIALVETAAGIVDGVSGTDGLDASGGLRTELFPGGLIVVMDNQNEGFTSNFKLISWKDIADHLPR